MINWLNNFSTLSNKMFKTIKKYQYILYFK